MHTKAGSFFSLFLFSLLYCVYASCGRKAERPCCNVPLLKLLFAYVTIAVYDIPEREKKKKGNKKKIGGEKSGARNHNHTDRRLRDVVSKRRFREARGVRGNSHWGRRGGDANRRRCRGNFTTRRARLNALQFFRLHIFRESL